MKVLLRGVETFCVIRKLNWRRCSGLLLILLHFFCTIFKKNKDSKKKCLQDLSFGDLKCYLKK